MYLNLKHAYYAHTWYNVHYKFTPIITHINVCMYSRSLSTVGVSSPLGLAGNVTTIVLLFTYDVRTCHVSRTVPISEKNAELKRNIDQMQKQRDQVCCHSVVGVHTSVGRYTGFTIISW